MNNGYTSSIRWLVRVVTFPLLASVLWRGGGEIAEGSRYGVTTLPAAYGLVALSLISASLLADASLRRSGVTFSRAGVAILLCACACSLAIGNSPGLFLPSVRLAVLAVVIAALVSAAVSGPLVTFASRASIVLFCASAGAAWQSAAQPIMATLLVRN